MLTSVALLLLGCDAAVPVPNGAKTSVASTGCDTAATTRQGTGAPIASTAFPALTGRVVDRADLLDDQAERQVAGRSQALEAANGHQFVTVTVPSLNGRSIEDFGLALGRHWGIGRADYDDGLLLIVAPAERLVRIEVGCGLEQTMDDPRAQRIIDETILPRFRDGRMQDGILAGAEAIVDVLDDKGPQK